MALSQGPCRSEQVNQVVSLDLTPHTTGTDRLKQWWNLLEPKSPEFRRYGAARKSLPNHTIQRKSRTTGGLMFLNTETGCSLRKKGEVG